MSRSNQLAAPAGDNFLSVPALAQRYGVDKRTVERWKRDPRLNFPAPDLIINQREYRKNSTIESWERRRATATS
jgi:hypothetical protein